MNHDFKTFPDKKDTGSTKWDKMRELDGKLCEKTVPLTVADMEFVMADPIVDGLRTYIEENVLGYINPQKSYFESVINWMERRNNYQIKKEWIIPIPGVKPGFTAGIRAFADKGEGVIVNRPVYGPMFEAIENSGRKLVNVPLINKDNHYEFDFEAFEKACKDPNNKVFLFCSPHNPTGRVWTRKELEKIGQICLDNGVKIVSDEVWSDFVRPGFNHIPIASISKEIEDISLTTISASKSFNIAGLRVANAIVSNDYMKKKFQAELDHMHASNVNSLGLVATELAYNKCEHWFDDLISLLDENRWIGEKFFEGYGLPVAKAEGTYLLWVDFSPLGLNNDELEEFLIKKAGFYANDGASFGPEGKCYRRLNIALPTEAFSVQLKMLEEALDAHEF